MIRSRARNEQVRLRSLASIWLTRVLGALRDEDDAGPPHYAPHTVLVLVEGNRLFRHEPA